MTTKRHLSVVTEPTLQGWRDKQAEAELRRTIARLKVAQVSRRKAVERQKKELDELLKSHDDYIAKLEKQLSEGDS